MPKSNIEAAIKRASGRVSERQAEPFTYEATMGQIGLMIDTLSDKRVRTIANLKSILKKGSVQFVIDFRAYLTDTKWRVNFSLWFLISARGSYRSLC